MSQTVTLKQIAEAAGVSPMTVSLVLRGTGKIGEETRQRVARIAAELGHRPNRAAQATRQGRYGSIALVCSDHEQRSVLNVDLIRGIEHALRETGVHLKLHELDDVRLKSDNYMARVRQALSADGLLLNYKWSTPPELRRLVERLDLPAVWLADKYEHDAVYPDIAGGVAEATRRLVERGHRRLAYLHLDHDDLEPDARRHFSVAEGLNAFRDAVAAAGVRGEPLTSRDPGAELAQRLQADDRPTALVCQGLHVTNRAMLAVAQAGLRVPEDISLAAIAIDTRHALGLPIAQSVMPSRAIGRVACEMLQEKIENPGRKISAQCIPMPWRDGPTVGPPPSST